MSSANVEELLTRSRALKPELTARYKVQEMALFSSFVRGEQDEASDIDVLVDFKEGADLFDLVELALFLEEQLQREVDVVSRQALRTELRDSVLQETVQL